MSNEVLNPDSQFLDAAGNPLAAGTLTFYVNLASTTLSTIYSNEALNTAQDNPYTLDASGRTRADIKYLGKKRMVVKDSSGGVIRTLDNVVTSGNDDSNTVSTFATLAALKASVIVSAGGTYRTLEHTAGYGYEGSNLYLCREITGAADDNGSIIKSTGNTALEFVGLFYDGIRAEQFGMGANNSSVNETTIWEKIEAYLTNGGTVDFAGGGKHYFFNILPTQHNLVLRGKGRHATYFDSYSASGTAWCIYVDLGAQSSTKLPMSFIVQDVTIQGKDTANGILRVNCKSGGLFNVEFNAVHIAQQLKNCYQMTDTNVFFRNYDIGLQGDPDVSNDNVFNSYTFFGGNSTNDAVTIDDTYLNQSTFINTVFEGSGQIATTNIVGNQNVFINPRWESSTPDGGTSPYFRLGGFENKLITPLLTMLQIEELSATTFQGEITGKSCSIEDISISYQKRVLKFTSTSTDCRVQLNTNQMPNVQPRSIVMDFGTNNRICYNNIDEMVANEYTESKVKITNWFINSTDMSSMTTDGLTKTTQTGSTSRLGPFREGLIQRFDTPTGNRRVSQDIYATLGTINSNGVYCLSFWCKSLTSGGETITLLMGRTLAEAEAAPIDVQISDTVWTRVCEYFKADTSAYTTFIAGWKLGVSSSGVMFYGPQFTVLGQTSGGIYPIVYPGGYVPTEDVQNSKMAPCYARDREHAIVPANALSAVGDRVRKIKPVVGSPKAWTCTVAGTPGTWTSEGNL